MKVSCPKCRRGIPLDDVNVSTDIALCRACTERFSLAELLRDQEVPAADLNQPPKGAWYRQTGGGFELGATTRSAQAFLLVPFTVVWSGGSLGGIFGTQFVSGNFNWIACLVGLPFLAGSAFLIPTALMTVCGKVRIRSDGDQGEIFTGIGPFGRRRRFRWSEIRQVRFKEARSSEDGRSTHQIELVRETKPLYVGLPSGEERIQFFYGALKRLAGSRGI